MSNPDPSAIEGALRKAIAFHEAGDLANAEKGYRAVLAAKADSVHALHFLGLLEARRQRFAEAVSLLDRAAAADPKSADVLVSRANVLNAAGRPGDALAGYDAALAIVPGNPAVLFGRSDALQRLGRYEEALASYDEALAQMPEVAGAIYNRGVMLQQMGRHEEALASYDRALALEPGDPDALNNRGNALFELRRHDEALASYDKALAARPDFVQALSNRANTLRELKRPQDALASCKRALAIRPDFADTHNVMGNVLKDQGRVEEAAASFRKAIELDPRSGDAHTNLGNIMREQGRTAEAVASYRRAAELAPGSADAGINLAIALQQAVPSWHLSMMNDAERNEAYAAALESAIKPDTEVLEIGTGSGLLAMLAARLGARRVTTCEAVPLIAATAREIVAANGQASKVKVIARRSTELAVGVDLPERADLLVSEILASELLGEGVLPSIEDAKQRLLKPGAKLIPAAGSVVFALFGGEAIRKNIMVELVLGFDLSAFNAIASPKLYINRHDLDIGPLSDTAEAFEFDFEKRDHFPPESRLVRVPVTAAGRCYGVAQWIRLRLDEKTLFENHPSVKTPATSWQTCFYRFPRPVDVRPGQTAVVRAAHNRMGVWFFFERLEG